MSATFSISRSVSANVFSRKVEIRMAAPSAIIVTKAMHGRISSFSSLTRNLLRFAVPGSPGLVGSERGWFMTNRLQSTDAPKSLRRCRTLDGRDRRRLAVRSPDENVALHWLREEEALCRVAAQRDDAAKVLDLLDALGANRDSQSVSEIRYRLAYGALGLIAG